MVSIFRKNEVINFFLLLPYTILLRLHSLLKPQGYQITEADTTVTTWVFELIPHPIVQGVIGILLVFLQALLINILANNHRLHRHPTSLAGMFYILLVSCIPELQVLSPALIGTTFILVAIFNIFKTYNLGKAAPNIFNAAMACSAATLIYPPFALIILPFFIGLAMLRNFRFKERLQFIIGFAVLFWIAGAFMYFFDLLDWSFTNQLQVPGIITSLWSPDVTLWWPLGVTAFLILLSLINYYNYMKKKGIDIRKKIDFFYWVLLCSFLSLFFYTDLEYQHYLFTTVSLAIFLSMTFLLIRNRAIAEILHIVILAGLFYYQFS